MSARVTVDATAATPPYEQIRSQIAGLVAAGELAEGDRLPTVRALAADLRVAVGTVNRAYRELEAAGVVVTRRRTGTVVAPGAAGGPDREAGAGAEGSHAGPGETLAALRPLAARLVAEARAHGIGDGDVLDLVQGELTRQN